MCDSSTPYPLVILGLLRHLGLLLLLRPCPQVLCLGVLAGVAETRDCHESSLGVAEPPEGVEAAEDVGHLLLALTLRPPALPALGQLGGHLEAGGVLWGEEKDIRTGFCFSKQNKFFTIFNKMQSR